MAEHRVSMLGSSLRRFQDPAYSADPQIRAIVAQLHTLEIAPPPRAHFRAELRAQLVAVAPRLIAEGMAAEATPLPRTPVAERPRPRPHPIEATRPGSLRRALAALGDLPFGRPVRVVTAVIAVLGLLLTGAVFLSRNALPGDALYGLKRASENVELSLASGPTDKAHLLLGFAKTRADEVNELLARNQAMAMGGGANASAGISASTASLIEDTLSSANSDVSQAAQLLGNAAIRDKSSKPLDIMTAWTPGQAARLNTAAQRIPAGPLHTFAVSAVDLVQAAQLRATDLIPQVGCGCLDSTGSDSLGPVPCTDCVPSPLPTTSGGSSSAPGTQPGVSISVPVPGGSNGGSQINVGGSSPGSQTSGTSKPVIPVPSLSLPSLPLPSVSGPVNVGSCGISASAGPINIGLGPCGVHLHL